ncbi:MAG: hypothetical protein HOB37_14925 [Rhodospirillaceae bacterium]|jgi:hypothetical protein|nr:hypothetical protein [Rhodospirillaceae bacterium]MBT3908715.1 hypothetical protein [Rhodospirillaceae bacterium]MBT5298280.1 hypothetical protein [Rhodospirillaceae bacterium]MBT5514880.1 hypothetical protein [Rhodospirillaceae bacterium]MBT6087323.1 hypothetical protein [Rhodospirillaceae bacterium]
MNTDRMMRPIPGAREKRGTDRHKLDNVIGVTGGVPFNGGVIHDVSKTGVAVQYPDGANAIDTPLELEERVKLTIDGLFIIPVRVARTFKNGFAVQLECDLDMWRALT